MSKLSVSIIVTLLLLSACSTNYGRYQQKNDSTPTRLPKSSELHDATPRPEPPSRGGNKNYQVRGKYYQVLKSAQGFTQKGKASWYGKKFHGHLTSNGEIYDMYAMSAAHKSLPLPTYLKVKNLANNKSVIVRVNDRGPFHQSRIIDLSYSAAYKLDMLKTGTANVEISAITEFTKQGKYIGNNTVRVEPLNSPTKFLNRKPKGEYIQIFATKDYSLAKKTSQAIASLYQQPSHFPERNGIFRVQVGPFTSTQAMTNILTMLKQNGYPNAFKVIL